jgi:hypothetical protein
MADISCNLPLPLLKRLEEERKFNAEVPKSITTIVQEALAMYFLRKDLERGLPKSEVMLRNQPLEIKDCIPPDQEGLIIPESNNESVVNKEIRPTHLGEIIPGPGVVGRMKLSGIDPNKVIAARRAKRAGREYDVTLEQYFNLI